MSSTLRTFGACSVLLAAGTAWGETDTYLNSRDLGKLFQPNKDTVRDLSAPTKVEPDSVRTEAPRDSGEATGDSAEGPNDAGDIGGRRGEGDTGGRRGEGDTGGRRGEGDVGGRKGEGDSVRTYGGAVGREAHERASGDKHQPAEDAAAGGGEHSQREGRSAESLEGHDHAKATDGQAEHSEAGGSEHGEARGSEHSEAGGSEHGEGGGKEHGEAGGSEHEHHHEGPLPAEWDAQLALGYGRETLHSTAGVSHVTAAKGTQTTLIDVRWTPRAPRRSWVFLADAAMNSFAPKTNITNREEGEKTTYIKETFRDEDGGIGCLHRVLAEGEEEGFDGLWLGAKLLGIQMPVLKITEPDTGAAELKDERPYGPDLLLEYRREVKPEHTLTAAVALAPVFLTKQTAGSYAADAALSWTHDFTKHFYVQGDLAEHAVHIVLPQDCHEAANCTSKSRTDLNLVQLRIGVGTVF